MSAEKTPVLLFFDHLAKNAGMAVRQLLKSRFAADDTLDATGQRTDLTFQVASGLGLITGHVMHHRAFSPYMYRYSCTVLRSPVERILSGYNYFKNDLGFLNSHGLSELPSLSEVLENEFLSHELGDNFQCRHFAEVGLGPRYDIYESAKALLEEYHLIGVQENLSAFARALFQDLGLTEPTGVPLENVTAPYPGRSQVDPTLLRAIEKRNERDMALWRWASERSEKMEKTQRTRTFFFKGVEISGLPERKYTTATFEDSSIQLLGSELSARGRRFDTFATGETLDLKLLLYSSMSRRLSVGFNIQNSGDVVVFEVESTALGNTVEVCGGGCAEIILSFRCDVAPGAYKLGVIVRAEGAEPGNYLLLRPSAHLFEVRNIYCPRFNGSVYLPTTVRSSAWSPGPQSAWMAPMNPSEVRLGLALTEASGVQTQFEAGEVVSLSVILTNSGSVWLYSRPPAPVNFSYHINTAAGKCLLFDGLRSALVAPVGPNQDLQQNVRVALPQQAGEYFIRVSLVQEGEFWFDTLNPPVFVETRAVVQDVTSDTPIADTDRDDK